MFVQICEEAGGGREREKKINKSQLPTIHKLNNLLLNAAGALALSSHLAPSDGSHGNIS